MSKVSGNLRKTTLTDIFGARRGCLHVGRPAVFFTALIICGLASSMVFIQYDFSRIGISAIVYPSAFLIEICTDLALTLAAFCMLALIPFELAGVVLAAAVYGFLAVAIRVAIPTNLSLVDYSMAAISEALYALFLLGGLELWFRLVRKQWVAILAGSVAAGILTVLVHELMLPRSSMEAGHFIAVLGNVLMNRLLFAALFIILLRIQPESAFESVAPGRVSKDFYLGTLAPIFAINVLLSLIASINVIAGTLPFNEKTLMAALVGVASLAALCAGVVFAVLVYKMWDSIQDGGTRIKPGQAVGYLFIPLFNLYWIFRVFHGFSREYNAFCRRHDLDGPRLHGLLFWLFPAFALMGSVPLIGFPFALANLFVLIAMVSRICDAVNSVPRTVAAASEPIPR